MKRILFIFLLTVFVAGCSSATSGENSALMDAAFLEEDCPQSERILDENAYQGELIDTHIHIAPLPDGPAGGGEIPEAPMLGVNVTIPDYVCMMDAEGTSKVFAFFPVWEPIPDELTAVVSRSISKYPDRFVPFIMPPQKDDRPDGFPTVEATVLEEMLNIESDLFRGYGEIGLYARNGGAPELPPDSQRLRAIYPVVRGHNLVVYFHLGFGQEGNFMQVLEENPDINFIWHGDQLTLEKIEEILNKYSNAYYGIDELYGDVWLLRPEVSKEEFLTHFEDDEPLLEKDLSTWKEFIERHPDQVLWGTDRGWSAPWSLDTDVALTLNSYTRAFIGLLDPAVQEKFAHLNAEKLLEQ